MNAKLARWALTAAISAATLLSASVPSHAASLGGLTRNLGSARPPLHLVARRNTIAPFAFAAFCASRSDQCAKRGNDATVQLTPQKRAFMQRVNVAVNNEIAYSNDASANDSWQVGVKSGDCEDYALTKRQRLLNAGWPSGALRIATARTADGVGHAVLVVTTSEGDLVLDNRTNIVKPWFATQLRWIKIQSQEDPRNWLAL